MTVVVVGSLNADFSVRTERLPTPGETVLGSTLTMTPGGKGANQAVAAARLGASVVFIGCVGTDDFAEVALSTLRDAHVDVSRVERTATTTGVAVIQVDAQGENSIVVVSGANAAVDREVVARHRPAIATASTVVLQGEIAPSGIDAAAAAAGGRVVLNLAPVVGVARETVVRANPLVVNEDEAARTLELLGAAQIDVTSSIPLDAKSDERVVAVASARAEALVQLGVRAVIVTIGGHGAIVGQASGLVGEARRLTHIPGIPAVAVDTTGAGDAFTGALAASLDEGRDLDEAARYAVQVAAYSVERAGTQTSYPFASELSKDAAHHAE